MESNKDINVHYSENINNIVINNEAEDKEVIK